MAGGLIIKTKWADSLNQSWADECSTFITERSAVDTLYDQLRRGQEIVTVPSRLLSSHLGGNRLMSPSLPDYVADLPSVDELGHHLDAVLQAQLTLARSVCFDTPFAALLQRRLTVFQRICYAVTTR